MLGWVTISSAQSEWCGTNEGHGYVFLPPEGESQSDDCYPTVAGPFNVRIAVKLIVRDDGSGSYTDQEVRIGINRMRANFRPHNIFFVWDDCEIERIPNTVWYETGSPYDVAVYAGLYNTPNAIVIYVLPADNLNFGGRANGIPSRALVASGTYAISPYPAALLSDLLSHEMGRCLGLYHPSQKGLPGDEVFGPCPDGEYVARTGPNANCCSCGDLVCDTPDRIGNGVLHGRKRLPESGGPKPDARHTGGDGGEAAEDGLADRTDIGRSHDRHTA